ncbi:hypothetical protein FQ775_17365 [Nitratireductor mangrovi]|uniref:Uncharacterized protein n=1 Tax=Nitratireductor mangrovi TaxID=2599600 RepID=A0A5B8L240_9HYPH|nr:hypothetical protein [Nitratireductor mangrovi]QDZ02006.1 hypothetical protein FQ775_17365 [Nitratireductor mangrovi]
MLRLIGRLFRLLVTLVVIVVAIPVAGFAYGWLTTPSYDAAPPPGVAQTAPLEVLRTEVRSGIDGYQRAEESTFLTYPEWAIVYAAREYAGFVAVRSETDFPYWAYIGRFWQDYALVVRAAARYPFHSQNHLMLVVIGTSHTIENAVQWTWENTIGRLTEFAAGWQKTPQDRFQAITAAEYAAFLDQVPWYRFPYAEKRAALWQTETASGFAAVRSWERKLAFGLGYSIKQGYAALITAGLEATADPAFLDIHVWAAGPVREAIADEADTMLEKDLGLDGSVFVTRRYQVFTDMIPRLVDKGVRFIEIGGNDEILLTVLSNDAIAAPEATRELFAYQLPAEPSARRTGLVASVRHLHEIIPALQAEEVLLEHVYDY